MAASRNRIFVALAVIAAFLLWTSTHHSSPLSLSRSSRSPSRHSTHSSSHRSAPRPTKLLSGDSGFHVFEQLYLRNGTLFLLSPPGAPPYDAQKGGGGGFKDRLGRELLPVTHILSTGASMREKEAIRNPTSNHIQVLPWSDRGVLGFDERIVLPIDGTTMLLTDSGQFMSHYYHLWAEIILGAWKALTLAAGTKEKQFFNIEDPRRMMCSTATEAEWRDHAGLNGYILKSVFPMMSYEHKFDWDERTKTDRTFVFEKVVIADRSAGSHGDKSRGPIRAIYKMMANVLTTEPNRKWWQPVRQRLLDALPPAAFPKIPTVTYISRQGRSRSLRDSDHQALIAALKESAERNGWNLEIPVMENMSKDAQLELASRTTVLLGVHGNGLTHQMWMEPSPFSTVIEIFIDQGIFYDYGLVAESLQHQHYAVWSDGAGKNTVVDTLAELRPVNDPKGYHGKDIRVDGPTVVKLIETRLKGWKA